MQQNPELPSAPDPSHSTPLACAHLEPRSTTKLLFGEPMAVCSLCVLSIQLCIKNVRVFWPDLPKLLALAKSITCCSVCHLLQSQAVCSESVLGL